MRILMVNNQIFSFEDMGGFLKENKIEGSVVCCVPGALALDIAAKCDVDMSILYVNKNNIHEVAEFLKDIKEANPELYNMAMVQPENFGSLGEDLENLIDDYIAVPIDPNELSLRLRKVKRLGERTNEDVKPLLLQEELDEILQGKQVQKESACTASEATALDQALFENEETAELTPDSIDAGLLDLRASCKAGNTAREKNLNRYLLIGAGVVLITLMAFLFSQGKLTGLISAIFG